MNADELARVERRIREICLEQDLGWILTHVDELVTQGQYVAPPHESRQDWMPDRFGRYPVYHETGKRPPAVSLRQVPLSATDRTLLLIDAILAVFLELPQLQASTLVALREGWAGRAPVVSSISFIDEEDEGRSLHIDDGVRVEYAPVVGTLQSLRAAVIEQ